MNEMIYVKSSITETIYAVYEMPKFGFWEEATKEEWDEQLARRGF